MPSNHGKYDNEARQALITLQADVVLLIVKNGTKGDGFSMTVDSSRALPSEVVANLPDVLRSVADSIEKLTNSIKKED